MCAVVEPLIVTRPHCITTHHLAKENIHSPQLTCKEAHIWELTTSITHLFVAAVPNFSAFLTSISSGFAEQVSCEISQGG